MPNWVTTTIEFETNPELAKKYMTLKEENGQGKKIEFDFNTIFPMPKALDIKSGSETAEAMSFYLTERLTLSFEDVSKRVSLYIKEKDSIFNPKYYFSQEIVDKLAKKFKKGTESKEYWDSLYELGKQYMLNLENYGAPTWYEWCTDNWGTKWNACDTDYDESGIVTFSTAWNAPFPILEKICEDNPNEVIKFVYEGEDYDGTHYLENSGGTLVETDVIDEWDDEEDE